MKKFLDDNFLLQNKTAQQLYHDFAKEMPIIDYHCHLPPDQIANDHRFDNLTQIWLYGDHYKWRAMRTNGINESFCTGNQPDAEKFRKWAETVPYTLRNPLYHWTHLELQRYFNIQELLDGNSAQRIYEECSSKLTTPEYSVRNLLRKMNVRVVCTTDDPLDSLEHHRKVKMDRFEIRILPAFRPDKAMNVDDAVSFNQYLAKLEEVADVDITGFQQYLDALKSRHDYFSTMDCSVS
jgi:glucuronate isomerase